MCWVLYFYCKVWPLRFVNFLTYSKQLLCSDCKAESSTVWYFCLQIGNWVGFFSKQLPSPYLHCSDDEIECLDQSYCLGSLHTIGQVWTLSSFDHVTLGIYISGWFWFLAGGKGNLYSHVVDVYMWHLLLKMVTKIRSRWINFIFGMWICPIEYKKPIFSLKVKVNRGQSLKSL